MPSSKYVATGETDPETVVELLGCALAKCGYPEDATEAVVDAIWSHDVQIGSLKIESARRYLAALVQELELACVIPPMTFIRLLDEELLGLAGLINTVTFVKRMKKLNTDLVYRQRKYNLLHEESEGYSKVTPRALDLSSGRVRATSLDEDRHRLRQC
jgi:THO complex subunit 2